LSGRAVLFTRAIVRRPARNFAGGLSSAGQGPPDVDKALAQHAAYCEALQNCGLHLTYLEADLAYPDGTFVEDTAIVSGRGAIITRPGAPSRGGEVDSVALLLREFYAHVQRIAAPGTVDGGDVCEVDGHFLIGVSARTNESGAEQLAEHLRHMNYTASLVDIRAASLLHLKSGVAYLGDGAWALAADLPDSVASWSGLRGRRLITVPRDESYAANCVRINDAVLIAAGYPCTAAAVCDMGFRPVILDMSEFRKMDGGLSCLSLRF
jgi:dimethylargininase